jgi:hypothetical protein
MNRLLGLLLLWPMLAFSQCVPVHPAPGDARWVARAGQYLLLLREVQQLKWPDHPCPATVAGQVEQESLWNTKAHLHTDREDGYGLAQFTVTPRFNAIKETQALDKDLRDWASDLYNPRLQLIALLAKDHQLYSLIKNWNSDVDHLAFTYAAYNGGYGGLLSDRRVCQARWFGHTENTSLKSKTPVTGYGQTFYEINRAYVTNILLVRASKYLSFFH